MLFFNLMALCVCMITIQHHLAAAGKWANRDLELLDEVHDAQIYQAVLSSVKDWERRTKLKELQSRIKRDDVENVCYSEVGCFDSSGPFSYLDMLPSTPEEIGTKFLMYPGKSRGRSGTPPAEIPFLNISDAFDWAKQGFNNSLPTKVLIHGFGSGCAHIWVYEMRSALMAVEEINVICVDWESGAILPNYVKATANTRLVGKQLAMLLQGLVKHNGLSLRNTHLIGFSLGAHVAGYAGAEIGNLSRITGLDPAGPLFESQDPRVRLDQSDAEFVDVIHSNGENIILGGLGSYQPMGHVDFYPNGGRMQKGCANLFVGAVSDIIWSSAIEGRSLCNHRRAYKFFTDSVSPRCHFPAFPCDSYEDFLAGKCFPCTDKRRCGNMGYYADRSKGRGQLYLITRDEEPFCAHQYHVKLETSTSPISLISYGKIQITLIGDSLLNETFVITRKEDEEMILGQSISKILVPHPILAEPTAIQILYTAYSGWLSSGLTQWRMDKVTLSDSFGKISSVCKKNLVLDSGVPVTLPLYPGECNLPKHDVTDNIDGFATINSSHISDSSNLIPRSIKSGDENVTKQFISDKYSSMFRDAIDFLHIPWSREREINLIDNELTESGRALNTRIIKLEGKNHSGTIIREIVEPILKPHSMKNGRSHNPDKQKPEITEPLLRATTSRSRTTKSDSILKNDIISKLANDRKEIQYNFYDIEDGDSLSVTQMEGYEYEKKKKRQEIDVVNFGVNDEYQRPDNPIEAIVSTVQFLPRRLAKMFEQAEKYARETILPLVSTYTPKFLSEIIVPKPKTKYVPLYYDGEVSKPSSADKISSIAFLNGSTESKNKRFDSPRNMSAVDVANNETKLTTPYTHIQKIHKKGQNFEFIFPDKDIYENKTIIDTARKARYESKNVQIPIAATVQEGPSNNSPSMKRSLQSHIGENKKTNGIYVDLPVFESTRKMKYIPLSLKGSNRKN